MAYFALGFLKLPSDIEIDRKVQRFYREEECNPNNPDETRAVL
jgi:hypothetical protein